MRCESCFAELSDIATACPVCAAPVRGGSLARAEGADGLVRMLDAELARATVEGTLTRAESLNELIRDETLAGALDPAELGGSLARDEAPGTLPPELDRMLPPEMTAMSVEGISLGMLLDPKGGDLRTLKPGFTLLRNRRYAEASEYWNLQRARVEGDPTQGRLTLLLLLLDAFTWKLAGDPTRLRDALARVRAHPDAQRLRGPR